MMKTSSGHLVAPSGLMRQSFLFFILQLRFYEEEYRESQPENLSLISPNYFLRSLLHDECFLLDFDILLCSHLHMLCLACPHSMLIYVKLLHFQSNYIFPACVCRQKTCCFNVLLNFLIVFILPLTSAESNLLVGNVTSQKKCVQNMLQSVTTKIQTLTEQ